MNRLRRRGCGLIAFCLLSTRVWAGGSGLNVVVIVNQNSTNSVQLGNYYCEQRGVPPQNLLRATWAGGNVQWTTTDLTNAILNPFVAMLSARQLTNQIEHVVLSMDFPYRVTEAGDANGTTAALFYGFKTNISNDSCSLPGGSFNAYAGSEGIFRSTPPITAPGSPFLVTMITSSNLAQAKMIVDQGVASDATFPTQTVYLAKGDDRIRNMRYWNFDNTVFDVRLRGVSSIQRTNTSTPNGLGFIQGYQNGDDVTSVGAGLFAPGAMADQLTSFAGRLFENTGQTPLLAFLNAGAAGSYGTVVEPCAYFEKFPSPQTFFYQSRGFTLAECYYQSVTNPYQGVLVGEPLAAPFAQPASGSWSSLPPNAVLSGATNLTLQFTASDSTRPVGQVDLFLDGNFLQTLTNIPPAQNNQLFVTLNGFSTNVTVPASATVKSVSSNLTAALNGSAYSASTKVRAFAHGDRIELQSLDISKTGSQIPTVVSNSIGSAAALTTFITSAGTNFLDTVAFGIRSYFVTNTPQMGDFLQLVAIKTNGQTISLAVTNNGDATNLLTLANNLISAVNTNAALQAADGLVIEDVNMHEEEPYRTFVYGPNDHSGEFNIRARSPRWAEAQIQVRVSGSPTFTIFPAGTNRLDESVADLQPRNHFYVTAGVANLPVTFGFNTSTQANGWHELTAVAYEGSHIRTQKRVPAAIRIQNGSLGATFTLLAGASNTVLETTLKFSVTANTNTIAKIELFSTGGSLGNVLGQSNAIFSVAGTNLGLGLHPFYALVTATDGKQYRTETKWIRLVNTADLPFVVSITTPPPTLSWPATAGRSYDILSATNLANSFVLRGTLTPTNSPAQWIETNLAAPQRFYRVRTSN